MGWTTNCSSRIRDSGPGGATLFHFDTGWAKADQPWPPDAWVTSFRPPPTGREPLSGSPSDGGPRNPRLHPRAVRTIAARVARGSAGSRSEPTLGTAALLPAGFRADAVGPVRVDPERGSRPAGRSAKSGGPEYTRAWVTSCRPMAVRRALRVVKRHAQHVDGFTGSSDQAYQAYQAYLAHPTKEAAPKPAFANASAGSPKPWRRRPGAAYVPPRPSRATPRFSVPAGRSSPEFRRRRRTGRRSPPPSPTGRTAVPIESPAESS